MFTHMTGSKRRTRIGILLECVFALLCLVTRCVSAQPASQDPEFVEPIFGLTYGAQNASFDYASTNELLKTCSVAVRDARLPQRVAVFASYEDLRRKIYVVGGQTDSALFLLENGKCSAGIPSLALSQTYHASDRIHVPVLSKNEISGLFQNVLERYTKAFGGKLHFLQWLDVTSERMRSGCKGLPNLWCPPTYHSLPVALQAALVAYRGGIFTDPIFNLPFDRARVHFEALQSTVLLPQCRKQVLDYFALPEKLTLYAKYQSDSMSVFIAGNDGNAAIYVIRGEQCEVGVPLLSITGVVNSPSWTPPRKNQPMLSKAERMALFSNALAAYAKAFGGKHLFLEWLTGESEQLKVDCNEKAISCPPTYRSLPQDLLKVLDDYKG